MSTTNCSVASCGKAGILRCKRCKTRYCSVECQLSDWKLHKIVCTQIKESATINTKLIDTSNVIFEKIADKIVGFGIAKREHEGFGCIFVTPLEKVVADSIDLATFKCEFAVDYVPINQYIERFNKLQITAGSYIPTTTLIERDKQQPMIPVAMIFQDHVNFNALDLPAEKIRIDAYDFLSKLPIHFVTYPN